MPYSIDFCIPYVPSGLECLEYLIENLYKTASHPNRINVKVSYHTKEALEQLKSSEIFPKINKLVFSEPFPEDMLFYPSANHSAAINNLAKECSADIIIFSDYDMAFACKNWDEIIESQLMNDNYDLTGVTYAPLLLSLNMPLINQHIPWLPNIPLVKYQNLPNLSFLCIKKNILSEIFLSKLTDFDVFLKKGGLPFRLINTRALSISNNLPLGCMQWLDTGHEIPEHIANNQLKYLTYSPATYSEQKVLNYVENPSTTSIFLLPEIFYLSDTKSPFLCHFKKGSAKMNTPAGKNEFGKFVKCINKFLGYA